MDLVGEGPDRYWDEQLLRGRLVGEEREILPHLLEPQRVQRGILVHYGGIRGDRGAAGVILRILLSLSVLHL